MREQADRVEVAVEELKDSVASAPGEAVVLETESRVDGVRHATSIEISQEDVPTVAAALLNSEHVATTSVDESTPAVRCLGAGVVHWTSDSSVRMHLQFDSGQVLPVEMSKEAALALCKGLFAHTGAAVGFQPAAWGVGVS